MAGQRIPDFNHIRRGARCRGPRQGKVARGAGEMAPRAADCVSTVYTRYGSAPTRVLSAVPTKLDTVAELQPFPWQPGIATGIGSLPGENPLDAARVIYDALPDFPHLAELPGRGPGADMIGRAAALLVDIPVEITARGWHIAERPGRDLRRAHSYLSADLDALEEVFDGWAGLLKLQVAGPWTLAATVEQFRSLNPALADPGFVSRTD